MNLQFFADGAAGAAGTDAGAQGTAPEQEKNQRAERVEYGIQTEENAQNRAAAGEQQRPSFKDLIQGDYKEEADKYIQGIVQNRLRNSKARDAELEKAQGVIARLAERYGMSIENGIDYDGIGNKLDQDNSWLEEEALEKGMSVETLSQLKQLQRENARMRKTAQEQQREIENRQAFTLLAQQGEAMKQIIPDFDIRAEMENDNFRRMVLPPHMGGSGLSVENAYFALHHDELMQASMQAAMRDVGAKMANAQRAGAMRPAENGARSNAASTVKTDPSNLTRADLEDIRKRAAKGEKIAF
jgi:hypothetical protein